MPICRQAEALEILLHTHCLLNVTRVGTIGGGGGGGGVSISIILVPALNLSIMLPDFQSCALGSLIVVNQGC